jgi:hypothetical protein
MPFLGTTPTQGFVGANPKQSFTANGSTTVFTLTHPVANANDLEVFVGNVRQEPTAAYTAAGTTLTMSAAPDTGLNFYVINKSQAQVTTTPPDNSVGTAKIVNNAVTMGKLPSALSFSGKTISNLTLPVGTDYETLIVNAKLQPGHALAHGVWTHIDTWGTEVLDNRNAWDGAGTFTVPAGMGGLYLAFYHAEFWFNTAGEDPIAMGTYWYKNGAVTDNYNRHYYKGSGSTAIGGFSPLHIGIHNLAAGDTLQPWMYQENNGSQGITIENGKQSQLWIQRISGNS